MRENAKILSFEIFKTSAPGGFQIGSGSLDLDVYEDQYLKKIHASCWVKPQLTVQYLPVDNIQLLIYNTPLSPVQRIDTGVVSPWDYWDDQLTYNSKQGFVEVCFNEPLLLMPLRTKYFEVWAMANVAFPANAQMVAELILYF